MSALSVIPVSRDLLHRIDGVPLMMEEIFVLVDAPALNGADKVKGYAMH